MIYEITFTELSPPGKVSTISITADSEAAALSKFQANIIYDERWEATLRLKQKKRSLKEAA